jgi:hypothetical protein
MHFFLFKVKLIALYFMRFYERQETQRAYIVMRSRNPYCQGNKRGRSLFIVVGP